MNFVDNYGAILKRSTWLHTVSMAKQHSTIAIIKGDGFRLKQGRFRLGIRKKFFTLRAVRPLPRLPREAVDAPSLAVFKARLDGGLSNLV